jgi:hypothetical protein
MLRDLGYHGGVEGTAVWPLPSRARVSSGSLVVDLLSLIIIEGIFVCPDEAWGDASE